MIPIAPILEYLGADLGRVGRSGWTKIKCPLHDDTRASATVSLDANRFQCFAGCTERAEDAIGVLQLAEGTTFQAARLKAEELSGVSHDGVRKSSRYRSAIPGGSWFTD